jgi:hypothetical protein
VSDCPGASSKFIVSNLKLESSGSESDFEICVIEVVALAVWAPCCAIEETPRENKITNVIKMVRMY